MSTDPRTPCLIGVGQRTWHLAADEQAPEPLAMAAQAIDDAVADSGAAGDVRAAVGYLGAVYCLSWDYDDWPGRIAEAAGLAPVRSAESGMSGTSSQHLLLEAARAIAAGDLDVGVVVGAEALDTKRRLKKAGERPAWSHAATERRGMPFEVPFHPAEIAHEVFQAYVTFALRDVARAAHLERTAADDRAEMGALLAPMTVVAARNPGAWFPRERTAEELVVPGPGNRLVADPYAKLTVAIMDVDMAAAVIVASHEAADRLGVPADRRVYLRAWAEDDDPHYVAEHPDLWRSPAMARCAASVLDGSGVGAGGVAHLDLYSCFASSVRFALDALGLPVVGDRPEVTVTGGLPFAGGPACNYLAHAIGSMAGVLRADPGSVGLVTGVGMHMTKHSWAAYSTEPPATVPRDRGLPAAPPPRPIIDRWDGPATVAGATIVGDRDGNPAWGLVVADLPAGGPEPGARCYGRIDDPDALAAGPAIDWVGRTVTLATNDSGVNRVRV